MVRRRAASPESYLPLRAVSYLVLLVLAEGEVHAYALIKEVARKSGGLVRPGPASVHRTLRQLGEAGLVEESDERPVPALDDARRRYFRLTRLGREVVEAETRRLSALVSSAARSLGGAS